jgi:hypothetical protein
MPNKSNQLFFRTLKECVDCSNFGIGPRATLTYLISQLYVLQIGVFKPYFALFAPEKFDIGPK